MPQVLGGTVTERYGLLPSILEHTQYVAYFAFIGALAGQKKKAIGLTIALIVHLIFIFCDQFRS